MFGIVETGGKVVVKVSDFVSKKKAQKLIHKHVEKGTTMVTDSYSMNAYLDKGTEFTHVVVDHSKREYARNGFHTNGIETFGAF